MTKKVLLSVVILLLIFDCFSQSEVRAWYADGQVFVVWETEMPDEEAYETYNIYANPTAFTDVNDASLVGRPFQLEYSGFGLKDNLEDTSATYRIPDGQGSFYHLTSNEGLFVFTPHRSDSLYFAVSKPGVNTVTPGETITATAVPFIYDPVNDPVECHLQRVFPSPFASGYVCFAYSLWADGRQNHWEGRPDFPIMANAAKNGMPSLFMVSVPVDLETTEAFPLSVWLHGGGGRARQSLAGRREEININPAQGILLTHDDKFHGFRGSPPHGDQASWHFGWAKNYNPFVPELPTADTIINYTQRRYLWIDKWLTKQHNIDTNRINIHGYSMGSAGALALAKCFPEHYGSATIFNTGCGGPQNYQSVGFIFGTDVDNFPTNLKNRNNQAVRFYDLWDLYTNCSARRDLPLIKHWHGKNDINDAMHWGPVVVGNFRVCDSIGTGAQNHWSERDHGIGSAPDHDDHWIRGVLNVLQTANDNVNFAEAHHRSDESFPAFFNHRLDTKNNDPGVGVIGIDTGDGDNWGTWGGYHRWEMEEETAQSWQATAWLEGNAVFINDNSPEDFLTADLAIRRPQAFLPAPGEMISWRVEDAATGNLLQSGTTTVQAGRLVVVQQVEVFREDIRKVRITIMRGTTPTEEVFAENSLLHIVPNPTSGTIFTEQDWVAVSIIDVNGQVVKRQNVGTSGSSLDVSLLPAGLYFLHILTRDDERKVGRFVKE